MKPYSVIGLYCLDMFNAIQVLDIEHGVDDKVVFRWATPTEYSRPTRARIRYDEQGEPFFMTKGYTIPFNEVLRQF